MPLCVHAYTLVLHVQRILSWDVLRRKKEEPIAIFLMVSWCTHTQKFNTAQAVREGKFIKCICCLLAQKVKQHQRMWEFRTSLGSNEMN